MTDEDHVRDATRGFRNRVASGRANARRRYLTPEIRAEVEELRTTVDKLWAKAVDPKVALRVKRIRNGATVHQSRSKRWRDLMRDDE